MTRRQTIRWLVRLTGGILIFAYGVGVGYRRWPPFDLIRDARHRLFPERNPVSTASVSSGEKDLLRAAFVDPVIPGDLIYPPIASLQGIHQANRRIFVQATAFLSAYETLTVVDAEQIRLNRGRTPVVRVGYTYQGRRYHAYAYGQWAPGDGRPTAASLIIPGSGVNQSFAIFTGDRSNYHYGVLDALEPGGDLFVLIKPNEDALAWHNGASRKVTGDFIWNYHLNQGGSYSASYLVQALALMKHLKTRYAKTVVAGLSQGGAAALLVAVQAEPTAAVVASGYSVLNDVVEWAGHNQLIGVPSYAALNSPETAPEVLQGLSTEFLFTWGRAETGTYKMEAEQELTARHIEGLDNVKIAVHAKGHVFPVSRIQSFLHDRLDAPPGTN